MTDGRYNANPTGRALLIRAHQRGDHRGWPLRHCPMCRNTEAPTVAAAALPKGAE